PRSATRGSPSSVMVTGCFGGARRRGGAMGMTCVALYFRSRRRDTVLVEMRLGLLGPSHGDVGALGRGAEFLLNGVRVHRAIYLGNDGTLDRAVAAWARKLVGDDPSDDAAWRRAADIAVEGTPDQIDKFV